MHTWREFIQGQVAAATTGTGGDAVPMVQRFGDAKAEHDALRAGPAIVDRSYRGLLEITGADRVSWLHHWHGVASGAGGRDRKAGVS